MGIICNQNVYFSTRQYSFRLTLGTLEMVTFFVVVNSGVALFAAIFYYFLYMVTFNTELLFEVHIHGKKKIYLGTFSRSTFYPEIAVLYIKLKVHSRC